MSKPQSWHQCDSKIKEYINGFISLLLEHLERNLKGVYLHGSLAMGCFYAPKSDIDLLAVAHENLSSTDAACLNAAIARYNEHRPVYGYIEFSLISATAAKYVVSEIPYILHYSSFWHERIVSGEVLYADDQTDSDLSAHITVTKRRGICLYGAPIAETFGEVSWDDFVAAVLDDLDWILDGENICESPYYAILNICRSLQMLTEHNRFCLSKEEGGLWGLANLPVRYHALIRQALATYRSDYYPNSEVDRKTGGMDWEHLELLALRDFVKTEREAHLK